MLDPSAAVVAVSHNLANALVDLGCEVEVATGPFWLRALGNCTRRYRVRMVFYRRTQSRSYAAQNALSRSLWRVARLFSHVWTLITLLPVARRSHIVHVQWSPVPVLDLLWLLIVSRWTPVFCTVHNLVAHDARAGRVRQALTAAMYRVATRLFVHTEHTARGLVTRFAIPCEKVVRIRHGNLQHLLELEGRQDGPRLPIGLDERAPVILFLGQIRRYKGLDVLLRSAALLQRRLPHFRVLVAGRPAEDMTPYRQMVRELGIEDVVEFRLGYLEEDELPRYLRAATVVALPYRSIDQSGVASGACTFGRAIVASRLGGFEEMVNEAQNGLLVPVEDEGALADALARVISHTEERSLWEANSLRYAQTRLSWQRIARRTLRSYREALHKSSQR